MSITYLVDPYLFPARGRKPPLGRRPGRRGGRRVDPYLFPARGRKPPLGRRPGRRGGRRVDPYLFPARGRKHRERAGVHEFTLLVLIPTFSPQGDGNSTPCSLKVQASPQKLIPTFSPQGDGNTQIQEQKRLLEIFPVDPYLFPARGRKLCRCPVYDDTLKELIPTFSPQGDGNRLRRQNKNFQENLELIPTFSPQGDGNLWRAIFSAKQS